MEWVRVVRGDIRAQREHFGRYERKSVTPKEADPERRKAKLGRADIPERHRLAARGIHRRARMLQSSECRWQIATGRRAPLDDDVDV